VAIAMRATGERAAAYSTSSRRSRLAPRKLRELAKPKGTAAQTKPAATRVDPRGLEEEDEDSEEEIDLEPFRTERSSAGYRGVSWHSTTLAIILAIIFIFSASKESVLKLARKGPIASNSCHLSSATFLSSLQAGVDRFSLLACSMAAASSSRFRGKPLLLTAS